MSDPQAWMLAPATTVGAASIPTPGLSTTVEDVDAYVRQIDPAVLALRKDARDQLLWMDPTTVPDSVARSLPPSVLPPLRERMKRLGPERSAIELSFYRRLRQLSDEWDATVKRQVALKPRGIALPGAGPPILPPAGPVWDEVRKRHRAFLKLYGEFVDLGGRPSPESTPPRLPAARGGILRRGWRSATEDDEDDVTKPIIPTWVWWVGGVAVVAYFTAPFVVPIVTGWIATRRAKRAAAMPAAQHAAFDTATAPTRLGLHDEPPAEQRLYDIGGERYTGRQLRHALAIRSTDPAAKQVAALMEGDATTVDLGAQGRFFVRRLG